MLKGVVMRIAAAFAFAIMASFAKLTNGGYSIGQIVFFRSLFALAVLVVWLRARGDFRAPSTRRPLGHLARGTGGTGGMFSYFLAVALLPLPDVIAIGYLAAAGRGAGGIVLGETVRLYRWARSPSASPACWSWSASIWASAGSRVGRWRRCRLRPSPRMRSSRRGGWRKPKRPRHRLLFSVLTSFFGFLLMTIGFVWPESAPLGLFFFAAQKWTTPGFHDLALSSASASSAASDDPDDRLRALRRRLGHRSFEYTSIVFAMGLGWFLFGEKPTPTILGGSIIVIGAGLFVLWRERRLAKIARLQADRTA